MTDRLQAIKARLAAATSGPWRKGWLESYLLDGQPVAYVYRLPPGDPEETAVNRIQVLGSETKMDCDADAELITAAPDDLAYLLGEVERLRNESQMLQVMLARAMIYLQQGKKQFTPYTTNSLVDDLIAAWDAYRSSSGSETAGTEPTSDGTP